MGLEIIQSLTRVFAARADDTPDLVSLTQAQGAPYGLRNRGLVAISLGNAFALLALRVASKGYRHLSAFE